MSKNIEWTDALNISSPDWTSPPQPLILFPKPDMSVDIHPRHGLSPRQLQTVTMFQEEGCTFAHPDKRGGLFPSLIVECKSVGTKGLRYVGIDQVNISMGTMLRAFQTMYRRVYNKDHFSIMKPRVFAIVFDQEFITFNFEWMFRDSNNIEVVNLHQTEGFWLGKIDNICKAYDLGQNFKDWLLNDYSIWVRKLLDDFWEKEELDKQFLGSNGRRNGFKRRRSTKKLLPQSNQDFAKSTASQASEEEGQLEGPPRPPRKSKDSEDSIMQWVRIRKPGPQIANTKIQPPRALGLYIPP